jgi:hypothetical protein
MYMPRIDLMMYNKQQALLRGNRKCECCTSGEWQNGWMTSAAEFVRDYISGQISLEKGERPSCSYPMGESGLWEK